MFSPVKRATLLYPSGPSHHLLVLATDPVGPPGQILMVPVCTAREERTIDAACLLKKGDHEFIQHDSYVAYRHWRIEPAKWLIEGVKSTYLVDKGLMSETVFAKVLAGFHTSRFLPRAAREFLELAKKSAAL